MHTQLNEAKSIQFTFTSLNQVLDHFYANYGGIWTGCFKLEKSAGCRGALAGNFLTLYIQDFKLLF